MTQMTPESLYKEIPVTTVIAVTNRRKGVNKCAAKITSANVMDNILTLPDTRQTGWHT